MAKNTNEGQEKEALVEMTAASPFRYAGVEYKAGDKIKVSASQVIEFVHHGYVIDPKSSNKKAQEGGAK